MNITSSLFTHPLGMHPHSSKAPEDEILDTLDTAISMNPQQGMNLVRLALFFLHQKVDKKSWKNIVNNVLLSHPVREILHKDPFTHRAFSKPRGYAGDAVMIDYIYGHHGETEFTDALGKTIYDMSINSPSTRAVRNRLNFMANKLNSIFKQNHEAEILSVACGHCREFGLCDPIDFNKAGRFIAMDQDTESLEIVEKDYGKYGIQSINSSVTSLIKNKGPDGKFDLVYALGLYDYLNQRLAQKLTENMFNRLKPGGELVVANFLPDILDVGYMESYMGWELVYRDHNQMQDLVSLIKSNEIASQEIFTEPERNIIFLQLRKN